MIIVEDGTQPPGANSYITRAEADAYAATTLHAATWAAKTTAEKDAIIITACRTIDYGHVWKAFKADPDQPMAWPRVRVIDRSGEFARELSSTTIPSQVKLASLEYAILLAVGGDRTGDQDSDGIASVGLGKGAISVVFDKNTKRPLLGVMITPMLTGLIEAAVLGGKKQLAISRG
jgi:hypothetical protein